MSKVVGSTDDSAAEKNICSSCFQKSDDIICYTCRLKLRQSAVLQQLLSSIHSVSEEAWREMTAEEQLRLLNQQQLSHDDDVIALTGVQTDERGDDEEDDSQEYEESYEEQESSDHVENNPSSRKTSLQTPQQSRRVSQVMNEGAGELPRRNHLIVNSPAADWRPSVGHFDAADRLQVTTGATTVDGRKTSLGNLEGPHRKASVQRAEVNSGRLVDDVLQRDDHRTQKLQMESTNNGNQANCDHTITVEVKTLNGGDPVQQQPTSQRAGVTFNILPVVSTANGDRSKTKEHERGRPETFPLVSALDGTMLPALAPSVGSADENQLRDRTVSRPPPSAPLPTSCRQVTGVRRRKPDNDILLSIDNFTDSQLKAWKGYYGNVYFEPIQIGQLVTRRVPIDRPWAAADVADSDACHPCDVRVFHLTENFYRKVTDDHRSSPPWVWKSDDRTRGGAGIGSCQPDDRPRFVRSQTNIDRTSGLSSASTVTASPPTASRQQPTRTTPIPTPRRVATARSRSSPVLTGATQRDRFEAASSAVAAVLQMHRLQNFGKQHVGGVFQEPLTVGSIVAASASAAYRAAAIPDPPETSPSVDRLGRRNELQSDKKKIRRGRSVPGRSAAKSRQQQLLQRSTSDRRRQPVDAPEALDAAANICLLAASAQYFRRETSI